MEHQIRAAIKKALDNCNATKTPQICALKATKEGYLKVESDVLNIMIKNHLTPSEAIAHVENYFND